jgi:site-specific DNA recombinase
MYVDKLDGLVDAVFFERMSDQWREEQNRCLRKIERLQAADRSYMHEGVQLLELARNAQRLFAKQEPREKRRLPQFPAIELHLGGRRGRRQLPPTV